LRRDGERAVEFAGQVLERDQCRQLYDGIVIEMRPQAIKLTVLHPSV